MDKLDDIFKKAIESHTEPYDPSAWEALEKRLNGQLPPKTNPFKKWGLPGAALVIGISLATWYLTDSSTPVSTPISPKTASTERHKTEVKSHVNSTKKTEERPEITSHSEFLEPLPQWKESIIIDTESEPVYNQLHSVASTIDEVPSNTVELKDSPKPKELFTYNPLVLPNCAGISSELKNTNGFEVTVKSPRRCNGERNPGHSAVSDREHSHATHSKTDRNYLGSAKFFVQNINAEHHRAQWCNEISKCGFDDVAIDNCPHIGCPVDGEQNTGHDKTHQCSWVAHRCQ